MENKENMTFSKRHPYWNMLLGFLLLTLIIGLVVFVVLQMVKYILAGISSITLSFSQIASKLDVVIVVALISGTISIIGIVLSSIVAKGLDYRRARREYLTQKREIPYSQFIEMMYRLHQSNKPGKEYSKEEMVEDLMKFSESITLWGSRKIIKDWGKFKENAVKKDPLDNVFLSEKIMNDMRRDLGMPGVKKGDLLIFFVNDIKEVIKKTKRSQLKR